MAFIELDRKKLKTNFDLLDERFQKRDIDWGIVVKMLCGNELFIQEVLNLGIREIHDSRISNLRVVKSLDPKVQTVYIKPPAKRSIKDVVTYADVSFNTEYITIKMLSEEAMRQNKTHKIIIMIELGDLREGVMGEAFVDFYREVFKLPNISVVGIGANLNCLYGVMPSEDKYIQLSLYRELIKAYFDVEIEWISGGTSVVLPMFFKNQLPPAVNHFRIGEALYFGLNIEEQNTFEGMHNDVFKLRTEIIELTEKPMLPVGQLAENPSGEMLEIDESLYGKTSLRAIIDVGLLDISPDYLIPDDEDIEVVGASSDMLILNLGSSEKDYKVGDLISFKLKYMGALAIMNSNYIEKRLIN
ncbi:alanine/ornithine racemase family PLP-dependent enzyme [Cryomorpha ignava]|uniref:Alanine/ornithine racemase family PLP-dependent enzyme n=1 Tax=Cryomorpha ignava TaxID=101383 RepID=A0A7K3WPE6_9FLAO|nr:alanine/ornithine racemase family PLP-dependent enzyme [Cryomorpha ignava]NEN23368.1 alanine/ornithine racemase family PLP-dependent enzyme [Cryomorpha ignava]